MKRFPQKRVFITGAGSGFGRALALEFAAKGWRIGVSDIDEDRAKETLELVKKAGGDGIVILCDVTKIGDLEKAAQTIEKAWGGVDVVVNNAGVAGAGYIEKIPETQWDWILDLNLKSVIYGCRVFVPMLEKQGGGHIINMASSAGIASLPEMSCYNVTKAAVISLSETLRIELGPKNIGVTVVAPTFFKSNLMEKFQSPDERQKNMANTFFARSGVTAKDVAAHALKCMEKDRLYAICQIDGKFVWRMKRLFPELYFNTIRFFYKNRLFDRIMGN
ncbi:MAG: SDR family oxidoreductase [Desulfatibacillaceae bacterium]|nr:SDR family oxidoreductase [Desulfatibacillaceae bacterium]